MTVNEFSDQFDVLYNNITSNQAPGLNEYEKSVFLTKALDDILKSYFNLKSNRPFEGFDGSERRLVDFSRLMVTEVIDLKTPTDNDYLYYRNSNNSLFALVPTNILFYINEYVQKVIKKDTEGTEGTEGTEDGNKSTTTLNADEISSYKRYTVVPIQYTEFNRLMSKPYKRPLKNQVWRLIMEVADDSAESADGSDRNLVELIPGPTLKSDNVKYVIRYVKRPNPIITESLEGEGVSINGVTEVTQCELDPILHEEILQRAVELAKASYLGDLQSILGVGISSGTEKGTPLASGNLTAQQ